MAVLSTTTKAGAKAAKTAAKRPRMVWSTGKFGVKAAKPAAKFGAKAAKPAAKVGAKAAKPTAKVGLKAAKPTAKVAVKAGKPMAKRRARRRADQMRDVARMLGDRARLAGAVLVVYGPMVAYELGLAERPKPKRTAPRVITGIVIGATGVYFLDAEHREKVGGLVR
jgi:hypothetical protein